MKKKSIAGREPLSYSPWLKRLLIMKMIVILLLVVGLTSSYAESDAQTAKLNLKFKSGTVKDVIEEIERQTDLSFMYDNNVFKILHNGNNGEEGNEFTTKLKGQLKEKKRILKQLDVVDEQ